MRIAIPEQFSFLFKPKKFKILYGGRAGAKSHNIARALLIIGINRPVRIFCGREFQNSIKDSVHKLLWDINLEFKLGYSKTNISIYNKLGTEFMFHGLHANVRAKKSMEGIDIAWIEEAETISQESIDILEPTIIRNEQAEIWYSLNPFKEDDAIYKKYIAPHLKHIAAANDSVYTDKFHYLLRTGYEQNPFLGVDFLSIIAQLRDTDFKQYQHIYGGHPLGDHEMTIIEAAWFDAAVDLHKKLNIKKEGLKAVGYDPSDGKADAQGAVFRHGPIVELIIESRDEFAQGCAGVYHRAKAKGYSVIVYDVIGLGVGVKALLVVHDPSSLIEPQAFNGAMEVDRPGAQYLGDLTNKEVFRNRRSQGYTLLADRFKMSYKASQGEYVDPAKLICIDSLCAKPELLAQLKSELCSIRRTKSTSRALIQIESKQDMKSRGMASPNLADAMMYANVARAKTEEFQAIDFASAW